MPLLWLDFQVIGAERYCGVSDLLIVRLVGWWGGDLVGMFMSRGAVWWLMEYAILGSRVFQVIHPMMRVLALHSISNQMRWMTKATYRHLVDRKIVHLLCVYIQS